MCFGKQAHYRLGVMLSQLLSFKGESWCYLLPPPLLLLLLLLLLWLQLWLSEWAARADPPESYIWTSHPWLLSLYLDCPSHIGVECPSTAQQQAVRAAMRAGV
jgi:hypothetical protein